jgi:hypothetical protein
MADKHEPHEDDENGGASRRAIDLFTAERFGKIDERLKHHEEKLDEISDTARNSYEAIFGGPDHPVGLAEENRNNIKKWGLVWAVITAIVGLLPWIWQNFVKPATEKPFWGEQLTEKWVRESTKRVKIFNREKGKWEYYYMIEEAKSHGPAAEAEKQ